MKSCDTCIGSKITGGRRWTETWNNVVKDDKNGDYCSWVRGHYAILSSSVYV